MSVGLFVFVLLSGRSARAACAAPTTSYGASTVSSVSVPATGTYRLWVRLNAPDTTNNSVTVDVGSGYCGIVVGDNTAISANSWTWVDYKNGTTTSKVDLALSAGTYSVVVNGREPDVSVDKVLLVTDTACVPTGDGSNCLADTTPPTVSLTSPVGGTVTVTVNLTANATDARGIGKVEFYAGLTLLGSDTTSPYSYSWDTAAFSNQSYVITARAYDTSGNAANSSSATVNVANPPTVSLTSPVNNATLTGIAGITANASSVTGINRVEFYVDATMVGQANISPYGTIIDSKTFADGQHTIVAKAFDATGVTATSSVTVSTLNQLSPITVVPSDDAMVKDGSNYVSKNFDTLNRLRVSNITGCAKSCGTQFNRNSYLKFKVSGLKAAPKTVSLRLYATDASADGGTVYRVDNNDWTDSIVTWNNAPAISSVVLGRAGAIKSGQWVTITLDPTWITKDGVYSIGLKSNSGDVGGYASSETQNKPALQFSF